jgi:hypothetical protein
MQALMAYSKSCEHKSEAEKPTQAHSKDTHLDVDVHVNAGSEMGVVRKQLSQMDSTRLQLEERFVSYIQ